MSLKDGIRSRYLPKYYFIKKPTYFAHGTYKYAYRVQTINENEFIQLEEDMNNAADNSVATFFQKFTNKIQSMQHINIQIEDAIVAQIKKDIDLVNSEPCWFEVPLGSDENSKVIIQIPSRNLEDLLTSFQEILQQHALAKINFMPAIDEIYIRAVSFPQNQRFKIINVRVKSKELDNIFTGQQLHNYIFTHKIPITSQNIILHTIFLLESRCSEYDLKKMQQHKTGIYVQKVLEFIKKSIELDMFLLDIKPANLCPQTDANGNLTHIIALDMDPKYLYKISNINGTDQFRTDCELFMIVLFVSHLIYYKDLFFVPLRITPKNNIYLLLNNVLQKFALYFAENGIFELKQLHDVVDNIYKTICASTVIEQQYNPINIYYYYFVRGDNEPSRTYLCNSIEKHGLIDKIKNKINLLFEPIMEHSSKIISGVYSKMTTPYNPEIPLLYNDIPELRNNIYSAQPSTPPPMTYVEMPQKKAKIGGTKYKRKKSKQKRTQRIIKMLFV